MTSDDLQIDNTNTLYLIESQEGIEANLKKHESLISSSCLPVVDSCEGLLILFKHGKKDAMNKHWEMYEESEDMDRKPRDIVW